MGNTGWLLAERVVRGVVALTVTVAVARYLGPAQFGTLSFALSFVLLFASFQRLGLAGIVIHELVRNPARHGEIVGSVFFLRLVGGIVALGVVLLASAVFEIGDSLTRIALGIFSMAMLFGAFDATELWLQSELRARNASIAKSAAVLIAAAISGILVVVGAPVLAFVLAAALEYVLVGLALGVAYLGLGQSPARWRPSLETMAELLDRSWPLFVSGAFAAVNLRVDQVMLQAFSGPEAVGTYAAAARLSELWYFLPTALATSIFPALILARQRSGAEYRAGLQAAYDLVLWVAIPVAAVVSWQSHTIIDLLYGPQFVESASILSIHVWAGPFMFLGAVLSKWLIAENLLRFSMYRHGAAALINVLLNLLLIPRLGGLGAAISTLLSYGVAAVGMCALYPAARPAAAQMVWALMAPIRFLRRNAGAKDEFNW